LIGREFNANIHFLSLSLSVWLFILFLTENELFISHHRNREIRLCCSAYSFWFEAPFSQPILNDMHWMVVSTFLIQLIGEQKNKILWCE
jgi:hypothetical protein